jgi:catechol 2,3-dioxygenase-like lactoylglutathione lyase family enzyme
MTINRFDHVGVIVNDLELVAAFFTGLGFVRTGQGEVSGGWVDRVIDIPRSHSELVFITAPDGSGGLELNSFIAPTQGDIPPDPPANAHGLRHIAYQVSDVDEIVGKARDLGFDLVGEVVDYQSTYRLAYIRGPEGIILEVAQPLT